MHMPRQLAVSNRLTVIFILGYPATKLSSRLSDRWKKERAMKVFVINFGSYGFRSSFLEISSNFLMINT